MDRVEKKVILASSSPRRRELLDQIAVGYEIVHVDIDESVLVAECATDYVVRMSQQKARRGYLLGGQRLAALGADTCVVCDGEVLGKPEDEAMAAQILNKLSDRGHTVHTAVTLADGAAEFTELCSSTVYFARLEQNTIDAYIATGEPLDKAGAYAIQGRAAQFITKLEGSYSAVMGLPLYETAKLFRKFGIKII